MIALTPLVLTYNEQENIGRTLAALQWAQEVVLIDSFSTDRTLEFAHKAHANVRVIERAFSSFADQCNFGLSQVTTPWVLSLDADYVLTPEICAEIMALDPASDIAGYQARFRYCVWGHPLRSTVYPMRTVLYRCGHALYRNEGHGHRVDVRGKLCLLSGQIEHDDRKPLSRWMQSQDRYMLIEAPHLLNTPTAVLSRPDKLRRGGVLAPVFMFLYLLFARGLILDGWPGWYYVFQRTLAEMLLALRIITERERLEAKP